MLKYLLLMMICPLISWGQNSIQGKVLNSAEDPIYGANVIVKNSSSGTTTDKKGFFKLSNVSKEDTIAFKYLGYKTKELIVDDESNWNIHLKETSSALNQVSVTANRESSSTRKSPIDVGVISNDMIESSGAVCLSESMNFQNGVRLETDCQTCNYTQLRLNGLGGGYSQILVNSRPIFGALMGLYGLEQFPTNWIDRIEVVRGGGSALYGSGAIGGIVNVITKKPERNSYKVQSQVRNTNGQSWENSTRANATIANDKVGFSILGNRRQRQSYDANGDGFSELPRLLGYNVGAKAAFEPNENLNIKTDIFLMNSERNGGDQLDAPPHQRLQSEERTTNIVLSTLDATCKIDENQDISAYGGLQFMDRSHYTGVFYSDGYGTTQNNTFQLGTKYRLDMPDLYDKGSGTLLAGVEFKYDDVLDEIEAYNYKIDQITRQWGAFLQYDWKIIPKLQLLGGVRVSSHNYVDDIIPTPRVALRWSIVDDLQFKLSYASGFRAPQAFDADLHISFAGGGIARRRVSDDLEKETSNSFTASLRYDWSGENMIAGVTLSGFYTQLDNAFAYEEINGPQNQIVLLKKNANNAQVSGISLEARANFNYWVSLKAGWTIQNNQYSNAVKWSQDVSANNNFLRTPNVHGYAMLSFLTQKNFNIDVNLVHTGSMLVPHFGGAPEQAEDELYVSDDFYNLGFKVNYTFELKNGHHIKVFSGVRNILNAYQSNFDSGPNRDSNFIYGPAQPRQYTLGLQWEMKRH